MDADEIKRRVAEAAARKPPRFSVDILDELVTAYDEWHLIITPDARERIEPLITEARRAVYGHKYGLVPYAELIHGEYYSGRCRNAGIARWNGEARVFVYWRKKFGERYTETIQHHEDQKNPHIDIFKPDGRVVIVNEQIPLD